MKVLKLFFVFALILGVIFGAFYIFDDSTQRRTIKFEDETLNDCSKRIDSFWANATDWDQDKYNAFCEEIKQLGADYDTKSLKDYNTTIAIEFVHNKIFARWADAGCKKNEVERYIKAIDVIKASDSNASKNPNVEKINSVYKTYTAAYKLACERNFGLTVRFNGSSWNSYSSYANGVESEKNNILSNTNYKEYLSNISNIKSGLSSITSKLSSGKQRFGNSLATEIKNHFSYTERSERTRKQLNKLRNIVNNYNKEFTSNSSLKTFTDQYASDVVENERREEEERKAREKEALERANALQR